ncbi:MAG: hypothetical protein J6C86_07340 [Bacteroidaceae bacterium]|nr:hypothetical protein [Bacteroidaceae bacterium]
MDNLDYMKAFGKWLCSIAPNPMVKSMIHGSMSAMYQRDYVIVTNLCNGFLYLPEISMSNIEGAKEHYKEFKKFALEVAPFSDEIKKGLSSQIDLNAEDLRQQWINTLNYRGIRINN